jgi:hypothetical protein
LEQHVDNFSKPKLEIWRENVKRKCETKKGQESPLTFGNHIMEQNYKQ